MQIPRLVGAATRRIGIERKRAPSVQVRLNAGDVLMFVLAFSVRIPAVSRKECAFRTSTGFAPVRRGAGCCGEIVRVLGEVLLTARPAWYERGTALEIIANMESAKVCCRPYDLKLFSHSKNCLSAGRRRHVCIA